MNKPITNFKQSLELPSHLFSDSLTFIEQHYQYQAEPFRNGQLLNPRGENQGSCKILGLALLEGLSTEQALRAFGEHYRHVQQNPDGEDHQNIRQLLKTGLDGVKFAQLPLSRR